MIRKQKNSNFKGNVGLGEAIGYFTKLGAVVSIPLSDSQDYDLIVDRLKDDEDLQRIQVRTTTVRNRNSVGGFLVDLRVKGGNRSGTGKTKKLGEEVDLLFVATEDEDRYVIPASLVKDKSQLALSAYEKYKV